ncbi:MAG: symmetrical bis(5'-nucleosyl)-tetraphosphatase [Inhella sp.]|jgi:bis(5'-nucleosyl)-tetraphosphatase (symmetrical)|uniref:symmetrical bis(5'-nucleosyl)-tetraphosphatase n=1 Tax=Inhella sp. TaxID=1921806 RepID=UPI0022BC8554|nr:symmetrical bis(5'-nucleosyl)-tetraphosphatase [Inhella sp.]MCZ8236696.1 symmetrical bis(5'-nucleosyl)-tetraphosphatase [Inhella sp.]
MDWLVGDLQGCDAALRRLLNTVGFSPSRDRLWLLGDLVGRGPDSLATLRWVRDLDAQAVLGNHDLNLLVVAAGHRAAQPQDRLGGLLSAPDRDELLHWLAQQPLVRRVHGWLLVHAGLLPGWTGEQALALSDALSKVLSDPGQRATFLPQMMGNEPALWHPDLQGAERLRCLVNAFTRLRFVDLQGRMDFATKEGSDRAPPGLMPWFDHPERASAGEPIAFGHWSTLGLIDRPTLLALDTGCVWGGCLSAARIDGGRREIVQVRCDQALRPGTV